jgi:hypothetical protein
MAINLKLFPKPMAETTPEVYPQVTATLPEQMPTVTDPFSLMRPATTEFNLVRIVEEHGPKRLEQIDALITGYQEKIDRLVREREKVQALVLAITK